MQVVVKARLSEKVDEEIIQLTNQPELLCAFKVNLCGTP